MKIELVSNLINVDKDQWNRLNVTNHPFTSYEFLTSLELSHSVCPKTGWTPQHIVIKDNKNINFRFQKHLQFLQEHLMEVTLLQLQILSVFLCLQTR